MPFNIFSTYYFQAIVKNGISFIISIARGLVISGILLFVLPLINSNALWLTMPLTKLIIAIYDIIMMNKFNNKIFNASNEHIS